MHKTPASPTPVDELSQKEKDQLDTTEEDEAKSPVAVIVPIKRTFWTENDPSMRLTHTGLKFDEVAGTSDAKVFMHSRKTYSKLAADQMHQAS